MTIPMYRRDKRGQIETWHFQTLEQVSALGPEWSKNPKNVGPYLEPPLPAKIKPLVDEVAPVVPTPVEYAEIPYREPAPEIEHPPVKKRGRKPKHGAAQ